MPASVQVPPAAVAADAAADVAPAAAPDALQSLVACENAAAASPQAGAHATHSVVAPQGGAQAAEPDAVRACALDDLLVQGLARRTPVALDPVWPWPDFVRQVLSLSRLLAEHRVRAVALHMRDAARFACAWLACAHRGVSVFVPPSLTAEHRHWAEVNADIWLTDRPDAVGVGSMSNENAGRSLDGHARTKNAKTDHETRDNAKVDNTFSTARPCWQLTDQTVMLPSGEVHASASATHEETLQLQLDTPLYLKTSGSTGEPVVVRKTVAQFQSEAAALVAWLDVDALPVVDAVIGSVSTQHLYGLSFRIALSLCAGWPIHRPACVYPEQLLEAACRHRHPVLICTPMLLNHLGEGRVADRLAGRIPLLISSAGSLPAATSQRLAQHLGVVPQEIYGSTETGAMAGRQGEELWHPLPTLKHGVHEDDTLWVDSPWSDGVQRLGDVVQPQGNGFLLLGRQDRVIKLADKRVSLTQIEHRLLLHSWVSDVHCTRHPKQPERLAAVVALSAEGIETLRTQGRKQLIAELRTVLRDFLDVIALPRIWRLATQLPRNAQGKLPAAALDALLAERPDAPDWQRSDDGADDAHVKCFASEVPLDLRYFGGHFEQFPLVPGVVEINWVMTLARQAFDCPPHLLRTDALKFRQFLRPGDRVEIRLEWQAASGKLVFTLSNALGVCASGRLLMAAVREAVGA